MNDKLAYEIIKASLRDDFIGTKSFFPREVREVCLKALEKQMQTCEDCRHADLGPSNYAVYCLEHSCVMNSDNCCRDWEGEDET